MESPGAHRQPASEMSRSRGAESRAVCDTEDSGHWAFWVEPSLEQRVPLCLGIQTSCPQG